MSVELISSATSVEVISRSVRVVADAVTEGTDGEGSTEDDLSCAQSTR